MNSPSRIDACLRKAFVMQLKPGTQQEYAVRHQAVWPELEALLKQHGAHDYSIFLHARTLQLFACVEIEDEAKWAAIAQTDVYRRWWDFMRDLMVADADGGPLAVELHEVYHLD